MGGTDVDEFSPAENGYVDVDVVEEYGCVVESGATNDAAPY